MDYCYLGRREEKDDTAIELQLQMEVNLGTHLSIAQYVKIGAEHLECYNKNNVSVRKIGCSVENQAHAKRRAS